MEIDRLYLMDLETQKQDGYDPARPLPAQERRPDSVPRARYNPRMMEYQTQLKAVEISGGRVSMSDGSIHLELPPIERGYADAQVDDYAALRRSMFPWRPPLRMSLSARASSSHPTGTLGFGFWNDPFSFSLGQGGAARRLPAPPQALWFFFGSPPNDMRLVPDMPSHGWKASSLRSPSAPSILLAPVAVAAAALAQIRVTRRTVMKAALGFVTAAETAIEAPLDSWRHYTLTWTENEARFIVEDEEILAAPSPPGGPLGFVAWIDNQYAVASPEGGFRFGVLPTSEYQSLDLRELSIEKLSGPGD
jgi:hypothetical protein